MSKGSPITPEKLQALPMEFCLQPAESVARDLLGRYLVKRVEGEQPLILKIIETEAYLGKTDRASHAFAGKKTPRTETLYLTGGHAYIYLIYGIHHCFNVVTGDSTNGEAVLIRAGSAVQGLETMIRNRGLATPIRPGQLAGGPGKLCSALAINRDLNAIRLDDAHADLYLAEGEPICDPKKNIATGPRIGIDYAEEARPWPLRFGIRGDLEMSRPILT